MMLSPANCWLTSDIDFTKSLRDCYYKDYFSRIFVYY